MKLHFTDKKSEGPERQQKPSAHHAAEDGGEWLYTSLARGLPTIHSPAGALLGGLPDTTRLVTASHPHTLINLPQWENGQVTEFLVATQGGFVPRAPMDDGLWAASVSHLGCSRAERSPTAGPSAHPQCLPGAADHLVNDKGTAVSLPGPEMTHTEVGLTPPV